MIKKLFYQLLTCIMFLSFYVSHAQYATKHYIAPAPWQYTSRSNQIVIGTLSNTQVAVTVKRSDGTLIQNLTVTADAPTEYTLTGAATIPRNVVNQTYNDRGLIIEATAPVLINMRNIDSDLGGNSNTTIKGNASLVSFGNEGLGLEFRIGYYRTSTTGLSFGAPVYSVMASQNGTTVDIPGLTPGDPVTTVTLNEGQARLFHSYIGALVRADKPVVMNNGSWGDTPQTSTPPTNGEDGTFDQIAPVHVLGREYLVVRGLGHIPTAAHQAAKFGGEQTTVVATEANTILQIITYNAAGVAIGTTTQTITVAGGLYTFYHGDFTAATPLDGQYSSSLIISNNPVIVYAGTSFEAETDVSTVLPIGGCSGITNIQTKKFTNYNGANLNYYGFTIIEHPTAPVLLNGQNIESFAGVTPRVKLGATNFYMIRFRNAEILNPLNLVITSDYPLTTSIVQASGVSSMSGFFSAFGVAAVAPVLAKLNDDCTVTLEAQNDPGTLQYEWIRNGVTVAFTPTNQYIVTESGNYSVRIEKNCGWLKRSFETEIEITPCNDLSIDKKLKEQTLTQATFLLTAKNNDLNFTDPNVVVHDLLPTGYTFLSAVASKGTYNAVTGDWTVGSLAPGETATLEILVTINDNGDYLNTAKIEGDNIDKNLDNNVDDAMIAIGRLQMTKIAEKKQYYILGEVINYDLEVTNTGTAGISDVHITDPNADPGSLTITHIPVLMPNEVVKFKAKHTITKADFLAGQVSNQAFASSTNFGNINTVSDDPTTAASNDPTIVQILRTADLDANKDDNQLYYINGQEVDYVIVVKNNGPSTAVDVVVSDPMPDGIVTMSWNSTRNTSGTGNLTDLIPVFNVGDSYTYNVKLRVPLSYKGDLVNIVEVSAPSNQDPVPECTRCEDIDWQTVFIPKGISPNGDGLNDFLDLAHFHVASIKIYNRYGKEVFSKAPYANEWYGQTNSGDALPEGTYFYHIILFDGVSYTGYIQLVREVK